MKSVTLTLILSVNLLVVILGGCGKSRTVDAPVTPTTLSAESAPNPQKAPIVLNEIKDRIFVAWCTDSACKVTLTTRNDEEKRLLQELCDKTMAEQISPEQAAARIDEVSSIGEAAKGDRFSVVCTDGTYSATVQGFDFYCDELVGDGIGQAVLKAPNLTEKCLLAIAGAELPSDFKAIPFTNNAGRSEAGPVLANVKDQLIKTTKGKAKKTLVRLDMADIELVKYLRGRFPGSIDALLVLDWVPVNNPDNGIKLNALLWIDEKGLIVRTENAVTIGDEESSSYNPVALMDLDSDGFDEILVYESYSQGGGRFLMYWRDGLPETLAVKD